MRQVTKGGREIVNRFNYIQNIVTHRFIHDVLTCVTQATLKPIFNQARKTATGLIVTTLLLLTASCASVSVDRVVPEKIDLPVKHPYSVSIVIKGGEETKFGGVQEVPIDIFLEAVKQSIVNTKLFSMIEKEPTADYHLELTVYKIFYSNSLSQNKHKVYVDWLLKSAKNNKVIFRKRVATEHEVTLSDALGGDKRLVLATEGAMRKNIAEGIKQLSLVKL